MDKSLLNQRVMKLMLQPLVENAIVHGIDPKKSPGHIFIIAERNGDTMIRLVVKDDGVGADQAHIDRILCSPDNAASIGLKNVAERIRLFYTDTRHAQNRKRAQRRHHRGDFNPH